MKIFATNLRDDKIGFYRIIQPLRMLKRSGWEAVTVPFRGNESVSRVNVHNDLLVRLSKGADFILTSMITEESELLRILDLRKHNNCRWVMDITDNVYANLIYEDLLPVIEKAISLADGIIVRPELKGIYKHDHIHILPSLIDFDLWEETKRTRKLKIGYYGDKPDLELITPSLQEIAKSYKVEFVNLGIKDIVSLPKILPSLGVSIALFPLVDTDINKYKDNISVLECMAVKIPIISSAIYNLPTLQAETNYDWYENIEKLIKSRKLRKEMAENGYNFVKTNYDMTKFVSNLQKWLKNLPRKAY
jgi:hypothetical protein